MSLSDQIIYGSKESVAATLEKTDDINILDEYGYTPLIQTAIMDEIDKAKLLVEHGVDLDKQDILGNTALHWTVDNKNIAFSQYLLDQGANPNAYTTASLPVLAKALLQQNTKMKKLLREKGADLKFAQDFINTKLLGHRFELIGSADIVTPDGRFTEVQYEGFFLETTIGLICDSLIHYRNNFAARPLRSFFNTIEIIIEALSVGAELIKFQHYMTDANKHIERIKQLAEYEPIILPVSQDGHALSLVKCGELFAICDRATNEDYTDNVTFYKLKNSQAWNIDLIKSLLYERNSLKDIHHNLPKVLGLSKITTLNIPAQVIGNCSWANIEAAIPALFFLLSYYQDSNKKEMPKHKARALSLYHEWRRFDQERALS
ncbi:MAG: ankyrin repeat domain-containing protein, partial [Gammaproteobacteria bacterium]|nr:ankyrin repeat domain-containing protein [Gammaproteobacteria bacterium]